MAMEPTTLSVVVKVWRQGFHENKVPGRFTPVLAGYGILDQFRGYA
jgi:hypothetical protein